MNGEINECAQSLLFANVASIRNNMSYYDKEVADKAGIKADITSWDIYHLVVGGTRHKGRSYVSLGFMLGLGKDNAKVQPGNFSSVKETNFLQGATTITKAKYNMLGVMLGYSFNLK